MIQRLSMFETQLDKAYRWSSDHLLRNTARHLEYTDIRIWTYGIPHAIDNKADAIGFVRQRF